MFIFGTGFILLVAVPNMIYAVWINIWGIQNQPEGFHFPGLKDCWRMLIGAVATLAANYTFEFLLTPLFLMLDLKGGDDAELRHKYALKGARCTY